MIYRKHKKKFITYNQNEFIRKTTWEEMEKEWEYKKLKLIIEMDPKKENQ